MQTIVINSDNDIYINSAGNLVMKSDFEAMGDILVNISQTAADNLLISFLPSSLVPIPT